MIETWERVGHSGPYTKLGDRPPNGTESGDAPPPAGTGLPAANGVGDATLPQNGEGSAPHSETPGSTTPAPAAASEGTVPGDDDDEPVPEVATMDYVQRSIHRQTRKRREMERTIAAERQQHALQMA